MSSTVAGQPPTIDELRAVVADLLGMEPSEVPDDANLIRLGIDSLGMLRLANRVRRGGVRVSMKDLAADPTLAGWQRYLERLRTRPAPGAAER